MSTVIEPYTKQRIPDVIAFERRLREEEDVWGWDIDEAYIEGVKQSFQGEETSLSYLAYVDGRVVGRIDCALLRTHFDGSTRAYLDWICVLKSQRHQGIGQALLSRLCEELKKRGITSLVGLTASNEEAQRFYQAIPGSSMHDIGIWIDI